MLRYQIVGQLESFIENRANDFREIVVASHVDGITPHQLLTSNKVHVWFWAEPVFFGKIKKCPTLKSLSTFVVCVVLYGRCSAP
ncbi:hypothetical protein Z949_3770 [Sulfitobacter guttiformis KCTC 32187]|uniref:Uncharacterized protein n=1 Tax=Sulfitobacter guttiformis TaxID=74349 RepID=A0A420DSE3_9RHOB|nr:hypothetical protein Z949_3770 [Sulfitobacter guttiformis KCTC 32187]RKE97152.1 hypothetical protein C8N30_1744 [Sulfitobacter guttiformis]